MARKNNEDFFEMLERVSEKLEEGRNLVAESGIDEFRGKANDVREKIGQIMDENRTMKLGIVGEVKAGKSSFLNALLFDGKDILPKAPTPMTAALTRLGYSEKPCAKIYFYNDVDWNAIMMNAKKYDDKITEEYNKYVENEKRKQVENSRSMFASTKPCAPLMSILDFENAHKSRIPEEVRACKEIYDMAKSINVSAYLSDEPLIVEPSNTDSFISDLSQYVGANGRFTPIVKYTEIRLNNDLLKDIEVIDTPGLNDPILSRSRMTTKFLMECDAVFLLSYVGQFLTSEDISFLTSVLPNEGINCASIIGSKFDSGILDDNKAKTFKQAYTGCRAVYTAAAKSNIESFMESGNVSPVVNMLSKSDIQFVSSLMFSAARHKENSEPYSEIENHIINQLKKRFGDFNDDIATLRGFANIDDVREKAFKTVKDKKDIILKDRLKGLIGSQYGKFIALLEEINNQVLINYNELKECDIDKLQDKIDTINRNLNSCRVTVRSIFEQASSNVLSAMNKMIIEVMKDVENYKDIDVEHKTNSVNHSYSTGHLWWKKEHHETEYTETHTAKVSDLQNNIESYQTKAMSIVNSRFEYMLDIDSVKSKIKNAVLVVLDTADKNFDENSVIVPLDSALKKIVIPTLHFDVEKYNKMIDEKLSGIVSGATVKNDNIPIMEKAQNEIFAVMKNDMESYIRNQCEDVSNLLSAQSGIFIDTVSDEIRENTEKIKNMLEEGKAGLEKYEKFLALIKESKAIINKQGR